MATSNFRFPVALNVGGRRCVVVGGGAVGGRKATALAAAGASVSVIAPTLSVPLPPGITHHARPFYDSDLDHGTFLVVAATDRTEINQAVADAAGVRGVLLNLSAPTDDEDSTEGDFITMATVSQGDLLIGITTGGAGPALSARLKRELSQIFGDDWAAFVALLAEARTVAKQLLPDTEKRTAALRKLAARDDLRQQLASGDRDGAWQEVLACLS